MKRFSLSTLKPDPDNAGVGMPFSARRFIPARLIFERMSIMKKDSKTFRLVLSGLMIALATVLSVISVPLPFGGSVTLAAMVPLVVIGQLYGTRWGLLTCSVYGVLQLLLGLDNFSYVTGIAAYLMVIFFDYVLAYGAVGLSGLTNAVDIVQCDDGF